MTVNVIGVLEKAGKRMTMIQRKVGNPSLPCSSRWPKRCLQNAFESVYFLNTSECLLQRPSPWPDQSFVSRSHPEPLLSTPNPLSCLSLSWALCSLISVTGMPPSDLPDLAPNILSAKKPFTSYTIRCFPPALYTPHSSYPLSFSL